MQVTSLVGNGSSIAYNNELSIGSLTEGIVAAFNDLAAEDPDTDAGAGQALACFAHKVTGNEKQDFEGLLGPLDTITQALPLLGGAAAPFGNVDWIAQPLKAASGALRRLHRLGLAAALGLIAERAVGQGQPALDAGAGGLVDGLQDMAGEDLLTIATLNYDGLLQAALPNDKVADLATGQGAGPLELMPGVQLESWPLRSTPDFPEDRNIHLLHLHGSLGWLRTLDGVGRKFQIDDLREHGFWALLSEGAVDVDPVVVLTDEKDPIATSEPFALGYSVFESRLMAATHWCVAGYSFLDAPVNRSMIDAVETRRSVDLPDPKLLVLGQGDSAEIRNQVVGKLGDSTPEVCLVDDTGLPASVGGDLWQQWQEP